MVHRFSRGLAALCCSGALLLAGCAAASSAPVHSAASSSAAPSSAAVPATSSPASAAASCVSSPACTTPIDSASLDEALNALTGWGGDAGSSLKSMIAACAVADWAEDQAAEQLDPAALQESMGSWLAALDDDSYTTVFYNWESVRANGDALVSDMASIAGLLEDSGSPNQHESYHAAHWAAFQAALDAALAAQPRVPAPLPR